MQRQQERVCGVHPIEINVVAASPELGTNELSIDLGVFDK
jgi:hypothetical protein